MFGHDWDRAEATIVARDANFVGDGAVAKHTFVADVRLASGEVFRATIHEPSIATDFWPPSVRDVVSVLVKPSNRKVKFDKDDDRLSLRAHRAAARRDFQQARDALPTSPPVAWTGMPAGQAAVFGAAAAPEPPEQRLQKLLTLHEMGLLSADEYAAQRQRVLDGI